MLAGVTFLSETQAFGETSRDLSPDTWIETDVWRSLAQAERIEDFGRAWIGLLSRAHDSILRSALLLGAPERGPFELVARFPEAADGDSLPADVATVLDLASRRRRPAIEGGGELPARIAYPLLFGELLHGAILIEARPLDPAGIRQLIRHLQWSAAGVEAFLSRSATKQNSTSADVARFLIGVVDALAAAQGGVDAARLLSNLIARRLECDSTAVGRYHGKRSRLIALSQTAAIDRRSTLARALEAAQDEAIDQGSAVLVPPPATSSPLLTRAHQSLSKQFDGAHILTIPLVADNEAVGAITLRRGGRAFTQDEIVLVDAVGAAVGSLLDEKWRLDRSLPALAAERAGAVLGKLMGPRHLMLKLTTAVSIAAALYLAFGTSDYRVRAKAQVQGEIRRLVAAPFDGYIRAQFARAGDVVPEGFVLAELQDNDLVLERLRQISKKRQYQLELDKALAKRDLAETNIARAQIEQADAEIDLSDQMIARAQLKAPFAAVVVSGDLSQSVGKPVSRGDVVFEIAPLDRYRVTAVVPEAEIRLVTPGQSGELLLSALPDRTFPMVIGSVTRVAQASEGVNGFEAIGSVDSKDPSVRPGMEGVVKIEAGRRNVAWIWFHPLVDWLRIKIWALIP
ncbi:HlyD family efflux transporter periplasmic adaptor subunit [Bradyrhizobium sp. INPA01-394B]|uniref:HlyD family efflux transporter periplasmic adaptor subunit n=1 Tax=Bradyrhizobium campsiandrae TaxID=1729892 RepID=A0ABR7U480_9BRAD|nr:HlyD family efflux transporter periplasmic adaptor subunit [Bradyrhizobium campsiandrae]MBC9882176.1 HlyD family efflux transporter periplasmic adaptor subunit [Bradyrhizobium campsiandrae]MBC9978815.1 HlyD family efflux transporter periplasmic adaptor subunit [Bradyrhizobium campsiandrae]